MDSISNHCLAAEIPALSSNRLMGMCRWMSSRFHGWIDYNEVAFSLELVEWDRTCSGFGFLLY